MPNFICTTCGTQYAESAAPPNACPICEDPRQYVKVTGQQWTTHDKLLRTHKNTLRNEDTRLVSLGIEPHFAIGQRAFFVRSAGGNVLWDCLPLVDPALAEAIAALGGTSGSSADGVGNRVGHRSAAFGINVTVSMPYCNHGQP